MQQPTKVADGLGQEEETPIMSKTPTNDSESVGAKLKAGTSQGLRYLAEGLTTIADALNDGGPRVSAASRPSMESQRSVMLPNVPDFRCGSFSVGTGDQYDRCRHKRHRDPKVVITLSDSDETVSKVAPQDEVVYLEGLVVGEPSLSDGAVDDVDTAADISDDWFDEGERGLVFDLVLESPMNAEEEFRLKEKSMPKSSRVHQKVHRKNATCLPESSHAYRKGRRKDETCQADTVVVQSTLSHKQRKASPTETKTNRPEKKGRGDRDVKVPAQPSFPPRDVFQKIEDLPDQRVENVAALQPVDPEAEVVVGYEAMWTVTAVLVIMALVVIVSVATEYYLYSEEGTTDAMSPKPTSSRTSNINPTARLLTTENRTRRIFVFLSEEETKAGDIAILDVTDET
ncbi:hypothetical protein HPB51_002434 [Rhipicephalus microplus]|uniref:Uncharacterized protein n=1 Tax=Rhipicephalus microplus TaxID=6941 RepID=A0A9J6DED8_RHIMP|nr:hypothetical protein HPB51_002434 [Rhipicephalus microplus]